MRLPAATLLVLLLAAAPAQAARRCDALTGKKVLTTTSIRIVSEPFRTVFRKGGTTVTGRRLIACARPRGTVRVVGTIQNEYATTGSVRGRSPIDGALTSFGQSAGTFLLVRRREADTAGNFAERTYSVVDVRTGRAYRYFHSLVTEEGTKAEPAPPVALRLDAGGRLAAILAQPQDDGFSEPAVGRAQVVAFSAAGERTILDDAPVAAIPPASLTFTGGVVGWTNAGVARTAP